MKIERASTADRPAIMEFINQHWSKGHILSYNAELFDWQYKNIQEDNYNFLIGRNTAGQIEGVLGFIPTSRYDAALQNNETVWLALWKVVDQPTMPMLGLLLLRHLESLFPAKVIGTLGTSEAADRIYKALGWHTGTLDHYYIAHPDKTDFAIARHPVIEQQREILCSLEHIAPADQWTFKDYAVQKTGHFLTERYSNNPFYDYRILRLEHEGNSLYLVIRFIAVDDARLARIVDVVGDVEVLKYSTGALQSFIIEQKCEYIDLAIAGVSAEILQQAGWKKADEKTIIPAYFEPFEHRNVNIGFAIKTKEPFILTRGDADQDRPSRRIV